MTSPLVLFAIMPRADSRASVAEWELVLVFPCETVECDGTFDGSGSGGGSAAVRVASRMTREMRIEGVSFMVVFLEFAALLG